MNPKYLNQDKGDSKNYTKNFLINNLDFFKKAHT